MKIYYGSHSQIFPHKRIVDFAWKHLHESSNDHLSPRVRMGSKHILDFTTDDETPNVFQFQDSYGRIHRRSVILGITYYFNLEWDVPSPHSFAAKECAMSGRTHVHRFAITRDRTGTLSILKHTFSLENATAYTLNAWLRRATHVVFKSDGWHLVPPFFSLNAPHEHPSQQVLRDNSTEPVPRCDRVDAFETVAGRIAALRCSIFFFSFSQTISASSLSSFLCPFTS
jgi:hypothetical protein